jgi:hypothetical protein
MAVESKPRFHPVAKHAFEHHDPYNPHPLWHNFRSLFRAIHEGNAGLNI